MAYAALVSLAQTLDQVLVCRQQYSSVAHHEKQHIQSLHGKIVFLSTFLEDFPREDTKLEARITVAVNQVEDIFELHILNVLKCCQQAPTSHADSIDARHNLEKLYKEIDSILKEAMEIKSSCTSANLMMSTHSSASLSSTFAPNIKGGTVVGFEKELLDIKYRVYGGSAKLEVIIIVGMGGIGKTTLARYDSVSQNYNKASILLCLLNSIDPSSKAKIEGMGFEPLLEYVYKYLKGRRFLIVVDDVWNANTWDHVWRVFPDDSNGSRVIITTRDLDAASKADTCSQPYEMHLMSVDLGWNLLKRKAFEKEQCPPELEEIGRQIAETKWIKRFRRGGRGLFGRIGKREA